MKGVLYLAWKYLAYHWIKTVILVASITCMSSAKMRQKAL